MNHPHVILRAMEPEDLDTLYKIENNQELWAVSATNVPYSRFALHEYVETNTNDIYADKQVRLMIDNDAGETVGIIDLMNFSPQHSRAEVGIVIMKPHRQKGYATAAMEKLVAYARQTLHLHQLFLVTECDNENCLLLFEKLGFEKTALLKQWLQQKEGVYKDACLMQLFL
ncbi:MAG: GNAT family N-acetyltransferase [Prevotella shahii]|jgi:acetyltransferase, GNAT family|uniref:Diamine N-acetyltransferase n=1 Tax=Hoylesella shahii DSM 15611 = JCM 12083 TaxID=1122991 RepID=A0A318I0P4_9BACT|nr:GNAT family N-acetyltransferase [Hoylesella shahii]MBF1567962.1 GNAT family N-acetyltransferase [Hoylesella shahii]PXX22926.1 diamine N-acetyltransferase [Hoylesella shahii DSM 15611 = JCM 12083]